MNLYNTIMLDQNIQNILVFIYSYKKICEFNIFF